MYGERTDALNAGVPTDRLIAEWELDREPGPRTEGLDADDAPHSPAIDPHGSRIPRGS